MLAEAIQSGSLVPGDELPSITELSALQDIGTGVIRKALEVLAADGLIIVRHGRATVVAGEPSNDPRLSRRRPGPGHDCRLAGCHPHVCHPMKASTIRGIYSILSGAFAAAQRWEWTDRNPTTSAKPPTTIRRSIPATSPDDVAKVIAEARTRSTALGGCTCGWWWSPACAAASCAACRLVTSTSTAAWCTSPSTTSCAAGSASARTSRPTRTAGSPSTRHLRADRGLPGRDGGRAGRGRHRAAR
jgi:hypothetical protein